MADQGIKKVKISNSELPQINSDIEGYKIRYRIVSEDKNRSSHWSPTLIIKPEYTFIAGNIVVSKQSSHINIIWDAVTISKNNNIVRKVHEYDVWIRWGTNQYPGDWLYLERLDGTNTSVVIPSTFTYNGTIYNNPNLVSVEVYLKGEPIQRGDGIPFQFGTPFLKVYRLLDQ